jgi:hypothetical protein
MNHAMKRFGYFLGLPISVLCMLLSPVSSHAIPSLGVPPTSGGIYYGPSEPYLAYFYQFNVDPFSGDPGFSMPPSGGSLTVWFGFDDGFSPGEYDIDIYLLTSSPSGDDFTFNGVDFTSHNATHQADGYKDADGSTSGVQYYGVNLGDINDGGWSLAPAGSPFNDGASMEFYFFTGTIVYSGFNLGEDWMFAMADVGGFPGVFDNGMDAFSPKTTSSSYPVPESSTMLLLGSGLIALIGFREKVRRN